MTDAEPAGEERAGADRGRKIRVPRSLCYSLFASIHRCRRNVEQTFAFVHLATLLLLRLLQDDHRLQQPGKRLLAPPLAASWRSTTCVEDDAQVNSAAGPKKKLNSSLPKKLTIR